MSYPKHKDLGHLQIDAGKNLAKFKKLVCKPCTIQHIVWSFLFGFILSSLVLLFRVGLTLDHVFSIKKLVYCTGGIL